MPLCTRSHGAADPRTLTTFPRHGRSGSVAWCPCMARFVRMSDFGRWKTMTTPRWIGGLVGCCCAGPGLELVPIAPGPEMGREGEIRISISRCHQYTGSGQRERCSVLFGETVAIVSSVAAVQSQPPGQSLLAPRSPTLFLPIAVHEIHADSTCARPWRRSVSRSGNLSESKQHNQPFSDPI